MEHLPKSGELYRHFKNKLYQIVTVAVHSETGEQLVIYQALYGDYKVYARPLAMFAGEVDYEKYPDVKQKYRFEKVDRTCNMEQAIGEARGSKHGDVEKVNCNMKQEIAHRYEEEQSLAYISKTKNTKKEDGAVSGERPKLNSSMMDFFDADDLQEKYNILTSMRDEINDHMINNMAVVLDVVIPEGKLDERYEALKRCIRTRQKYETNRLR